MKCPHCQANDNNKVAETRKHGENVYRRRKCLSCGKNFVSVESAPPGAVMPSEIKAKRKADAPATAAGRASEPFAGVSTVHLQSIWK